MRHPVLVHFQDKDLGAVPSEVYFLKLMRKQRNVVNFLHFEKVSQQQFVIVMERPENFKDMYNLRSEKSYPLSEEETRKVLRKIVGAAREIEKQEFAHRDIKLENLIYDLDTDDVKLVDFGLAKAHSPGQIFKSFAGESQLSREYL